MPKRIATSEKGFGLGALALCLSLCLLSGGCRKDATKREAAEAPPATPDVVTTGSDNLVHVADTSHFPLIAATPRSTFATLNATGAVQPDISREVPVLSIANGRVTALHVTLGQSVHKGQLVMDVQSPDVSSAFASYLQAVSNENLANTTLKRDKLLYDKGAIAQSLLEAAQNGEETAHAVLVGAEQQLHILGVNKDHPSETVQIFAPISGTVVAQNTTAAGIAGITYAGATGSLTIADLSHVWVVCDVYENDLASVRLGEAAQIRLSAFPEKPRTGTISDIGAILDPSIRTAKVRIQVQNPDNLLRIGMFANATFTGSKAQTTVAVPSDAVLHLHDHDYVFVPGTTAGDFRRVTVQTGNALPGNVVEVRSGLNVGQNVVANALELQNTAGQ